MRNIVVSEIKNLLKTNLIGSEVLVFDRVESTNESIKDHLSHKEGLVILANAQTRGKGRLGRQWHSAQNAGIYFSTFLKPKLDPARLSAISLMSGFAVLLALRPFCLEYPITLKWPNDILLNQKKLAGILCEYGFSEKHSNALIIGIGINLNHLASDFPEPIDKTATSLRIETGREANPIPIIASLISHLEDEYFSLMNQGIFQLIKKWTDHSNFFGKKITLVQGGVVYNGVASHLNDEGKLAVITVDGKTHYFDSGEIAYIAKTETNESK